MTHSTDYVLGQSEAAARRLEIQDASFADASEQLLDDLELRPTDRIVEMGCGAGSFSRRVLRRLGADGVLVGVDVSQGLLDQAVRSSHVGPARFEAVAADIVALGTWLDGADAIVGRTVLHHVPMAEFLLGRLLARLRPGVKVGFLEPDFRGPLAHLAALEALGRHELAPLRTWAMCINQLYEVKRISPAVGATLAQALAIAGCKNVRATWSECPSNETTIDNMLMFYDEVRGRLDELGILSAAEVDEQSAALRSLPRHELPAVWGAFAVCAET